MMDGSGFSPASYRTQIRKLSTQFNWHLLNEQEWTEAALQSFSDLIGPKDARRACLQAYSHTLYEACLDSTCRDQAYRELYDYLWPQAYYRDRHLAEDVTQTAILLIFEALQSPDPKKQPKSAETFLAFANYKLWDAIKRERRFANDGRVVEAPQSEDETDLLEDWWTQLSDHPPSLLDEMIKKEQIVFSVKLVALEVLNCLERLWRVSRLRRQLRTILLTYIDRIPDSRIAERMNTKVKNVEVLRSRGLDKLRSCMDMHLPSREMLEKGEIK